MHDIGDTPTTPVKKHVRWIGFDMDECLGSVMCLWAYSDYLIPRLPHSMQTRVLEKIAREIAFRAFEPNQKTWIFRPDLDSILEFIIRAYNEKQITGCFILSNNNGKYLVELVRLVMNYRCLKLGGQVSMFKAGWHRSAPCRKGSMKKSWDIIQHCLTYSKLPTMSSPNDLLFYDDMLHVLSSEIPNYVQVTPYFNYTPYEQVFEQLEPVLKSAGVPVHLIEKTLQYAKMIENQDLLTNEDLRMKTPEPEDNNLMRIFMKGLEKFLVHKKRKTVRRINVGSKRFRQKRKTFRAEMKVGRNKL